MTSFREQLLLDEAVFLNPEEFAEEIEWNGTSQWWDPETSAWRPLLAVIDREEMDPREEMGVFSEQLRVFVSERMIARPVPEQEITLNGKPFYVHAVDAEGGMLEIIIFKHGA